jgi:hypothetical protein
MTFNPQTPIKIEKLKQKLEPLGLRECEHFVAAWRGGNRGGYLYIKKEGIIELAHVAKYGVDKAQRREAASLIEHLHKRAKMKGREVLERLEELIREGEKRGTLTELPRGVAEIEWEGRRIATPVEVKKMYAEEDGGKLRIYVTAVVGGVGGEWTMTFYRHSKTNAALGYTILSVKAPGGRDEDAKRIKALVKVPTGEEPSIDNNHERVEYTRRHLEGLKRYAELVAIVGRWEKSA